LRLQAQGLPIRLIKQSRSDCTFLHQYQYKGLLGAS